MQESRAKGIWLIAGCCLIACSLGLDDDKPRPSLAEEYLRGGPQLSLFDGPDDCFADTTSEAAGLTDLRPLGIPRRPSGMCARAGLQRQMDYYYAWHRVWLDRMLEERRHWINRDGDAKSPEIERLDYAIVDAVMALRLGDEDPGPLPFEVTEADYPPSPTVTLEQVRRANNTTPKVIITPDSKATDRPDHNRK